MLLGNQYLFLFPSKTHKKFPSQLDKVGWFPSQLIKVISQPGIPRTLGLSFLRRNHSDQPSYACDYSLGEGRGSFFFFFFFSRSQSSEFLQPSRVEMLEKVNNSQEKPLSIINFPSKFLIEIPAFLPASKIPLGNR